MSKHYTSKETNKLISIIPVLQPHFSKWLQSQDKITKNWVQQNNFIAKSGQYCLLPDKNGDVAKVFLGLANTDDFWSFGALPACLKTGDYVISTSQLSNEQMQKAVIAWGLGCYNFVKYKTGKKNEIKARLLIPKCCDAHHIKNVVTSINSVRDLINYPADDLSPTELGKAAEDLAHQFSAKIKQIIGDDLLQKNFPAVHIVGRGSAKPPRLIDMHWGEQNSNAPKIVLIGKGVCFDSGGLIIKPESGMLHMKKDMAGAAHVLGLARMIMLAKLPVQLRVIIPAVENLVSGSCYKPGDVVITRKGISVEINDTDSEGRVILADALALAAEDNPDLIIDFATLTGAARIALGPEIPAFFTDDDNLAAAISDSAKQEGELVWRLPLYRPYHDFIESKIGDIRNYAGTGLGGAITAALFLRDFVPASIPWVHFDIMGMNVKSMPGRPEGGEAMALRCVFNYISKCFLAKK